MAQRLPTVGGDDNSWGTVLNNYLLVGHNADGTTVTINKITSSYNIGTSETGSSIKINEVILANANSASLTVTLPDATSSSYNNNLYVVKKKPIAPPIP